MEISYQYFFLIASIAPCESFYILHVGWLGATCPVRIHKTLEKIAVDRPIFWPHPLIKFLWAVGVGNI